MSETPRISQDSAVPPVAQIQAWYAAAIDDGDLSPGDRLPTVRGLAENLGLAVNTVARAYKELEAAGLIETRGRAGSVVASRADHAAQAEIAAHARTYLAQARRLNVTLEEAVTAVRDAARA